MATRHKADFNSTIAGIPCGIRVTWHVSEVPMRITGSGFGDADPPEPPEFEYDVLDRKGYPAQWLADKLTEADDDRLLAEYEDVINEFR